LTSLPQVNIPAGIASEIPVGLSLIGWRGGDAALVGAACALAEAIRANPPNQRRPETCSELPHC
jgi:amidase